MIASRGNVIRALLGIHLYFGFLTVFVISQKEKWSDDKRNAFRIAKCIADCCYENDISLLDPRDDESKVDVLFCWIISANYRRHVFCFVLLNLDKNRARI